MRLKNKISIITGSSAGIGAEIARAFAREEAIPVITYKTHKAEAELLASEIGCELVMSLDVGDRESIRKLMKATADRYGRVDVLINNAGVNITGDFDQITDEQWDTVLDTDLKGVFLCCQEVLPYICNNGRIINIGSLSGEYGGPRTPSYAAAKAGVMALTHCLARFVGHRGITVNCLSPGVIESELTARSMPPELKEKILSQILLGRLGRYEEVAGAAVFLASDDSSYVTAQTISPNGGIWVR